MPNSEELFSGVLKYVASGSKFAGSWGAKGGRLAKVAAKEKGAGIATRALVSRGRRTMAAGGAAALGLGVIGRSSGARGLSPRSSAPPPSDPYRGY